MEKIQIAISDARYRSGLVRMLRGTAPCDVVCVEELDPEAQGVVVVDFDHLERMGTSLRRPDRVVLVAHENQESLARAWEAGVNSVVYDRDPLNTAVLAILAARLRASRALPSEGGVR